MVDKVIGGRDRIGGIGVGTNVMERGGSRKGAKEGEEPAIQRTSGEGGPRMRKGRVL
jgi:hypothetical protein